MDVEKGDVFTSPISEGLIYAVLNLLYKISRVFNVTPDLTTQVSAWTRQNIGIDVVKGQQGLQLKVRNENKIWELRSTKSERQTLLEMFKYLEENFGLCADLVVHDFVDQTTLVAAALRQGLLPELKIHVQGSFNSQGNCLYLVSN